MSTVCHNLDTGFIAAPSIMTDDNQHEVRCGMCARSVFVDEETYRFSSDAIESGLDNPFRCELCAEEYDDDRRG